MALAILIVMMTSFIIIVAVKPLPGEEVYADSCSMFINDPITL